MKIVLYSYDFKLYIDSLPNEILKAKFFRYIKMLEEKGSLLCRPYADYLKDNIYELRVDDNRALYFFIHKDYIIISHSFIKKQDKVPENEIATAKKIGMNFLNNFQAVIFWKNIWRNYEEICYI